MKNAVVLFALLAASASFAQSFEDYKKVEAQRDSLKEQCRMNRTVTCDAELSEFRKKLEELEKIPSVKAGKVRELRLLAWDRAKAYCDKETATAKDSAMKFEIQVHKPELLAKKDKLDRKNFCHCRADGRLKAFGKEAAGSYYVLNDSGLDLTSNLSPETLKEAQDKEREIFISCFESNS